jgi:hypothetical protein
VGETGGDLAAREHLHDGERRLTTRQLREHDAFERLVVFTEDEVAETLADLPLHYLQLAPDVVHVGAAGGELGLELWVVGTEAELHAAVRHECLHSREERVHVRFAQAVRVKALQVDDGLQPALGEEARDDLFFEHATELARDAGSEEEARLADVEGEAAGGADGVVDHLRGDRQHGLLPVVGRHGAAAPAEEVFHADEPLVVENELDPGGLGRDLLGEIVDGGPEAAVDDDRVGPLGGELEGLEQALPVVAHGGFPADGEPHVGKLLAHVAEVGIDGLAREHFVTGADDLEPHCLAFQEPANDGRS